MERLDVADNFWKKEAISVRSFYECFKSNEYVANKSYRYQKVVLTGKAEMIRSESNCVILVLGYDNAPTILCGFSLRDTKKLYFIVRGDIVTLKEVCYGMKFPYIWMRERSLLILAAKSCLIKTTFCS
ncbi:OB-fold protein [Coprobacter sp.]|uniref:OB-fold protein n=1 Tax=Coprobacter sp. TaxID=1941478 RepID=UPI003AB2C42B